MGKLVITSALAGALLFALAPAEATHVNLLPNSSFEQTPVPPAVVSLAFNQPIIPTGWAFEGSAGLFDHYPAGSGGRTAHSGARGIAISIPASGRRQICVDPSIPCQNNPANPVKDATDHVYTVTPHWRTLDPVAVSAGATYRLSFWTQLDFVTLGEGAVSKVRWLNSMGVPISETNGPTRRVQFVQETTTPWEQLSATMIAPTGATRAHVLLGHSDDTWLGQVRFDDAFFGINFP